jgi:hypothetical protein
MKFHGEISELVVKPLLGQAEHSWSRPHHENGVALATFQMPKEQRLGAFEFKIILLNTFGA